MADDVQQMVQALQGAQPQTPPRWSDYAREAVNTGGASIPLAGFNGPVTSEGAVEMIMGVDPIVQALRGVKDLTDKLGITKPMRSYPSQINILREDKT